MKYASKALWPTGSIVQKRANDITTDYHATKNAALAVCRMLDRIGLGGDRRIFPVKTWVEEIKETAMTKPKRERSPCVGCNQNACNMSTNYDKSVCYDFLDYTIRRLREENRDMKRAMKNWCQFRHCPKALPSEPGQMECELRGLCELYKFTKGGNAK